MKKLLLSVFAAVLTICGLNTIAAIAPTYAQVTCMNGNKVATLAECPEYEDIEQKGDLTSIVKTIINVIIGVVGFVAVVMMIIGGISFITSQGDAAKVTKARNTILYGVVGLIVAILAFAIVNFVLNSLFK